ncbi:MAG: hypothetical protein P9M14_11050 [Candidatus Alcyoniella australis]|nr:hypothetical protein [Candidatus Alcyoniella australis]
MKSLKLLLVLLLAVALLVCACEQGDDDDDDVAGDDDDGDDDDDDDEQQPLPLIPGPGQQGYDAELETLARIYDRQFHVFNAAGMGLNADIYMDPVQTADRAAIEDFLRNSDGWDFAAYLDDGRDQFDVITAWQKVAGLYGGVGIVADAFRYAVLRDSGQYDEDEIELARQHLLAALEGLHIATGITGVPGVIARGFIRCDIPSECPQHATEILPLFDEHGVPLPYEKDNGTWRNDNSGGGFANYIWEDSCSRDQYIGWVSAYAACWEVIRDDPAIDQAIKDRLQADATAVGRELMVVRSTGYDLELPDADGRITFHGYLNENNFDRIYLPFLPFKNAMMAVMALGSAAAFAYVSDDPELDYYLNEVLINQRGLNLIVRSDPLFCDMGLQSNFSNYNMTFQGFWLALRYVEDPLASEDLRYAVQYALYQPPDRPRNPIEQKMSMYDLVYAAGAAGSSVYAPRSLELDAQAVARAIQTLKEFPVPPYWENEVINCDQDEIDSGVCYGVDGTRLDLLGYVGRGDKLVSVQPVPMRIRPASNYHWRSNPYEVNGGGNGSRLVPAVDFRWAYWMGRWTR